MQHVAIVSSGGDAPGTNAAIRAAARIALLAGVRVSGVVHGWAGAPRGELIDINRDTIHGIIEEGGTFLKSERSPILTQEGDAQRVIEGLSAHGVEGVIVIGGEGSHKGALKVAQAGFPVIGVPKTIDNDLGGTDFTVGFHTAVETATHAIDRVRTHTESNDRVMIVEVMGRHAGWIATFSGMASGADLILIPERKWSIEGIHEHLAKRHGERGRSFSLIVLAEGAISSQSEIDLSRDARRDHLGRTYLGGLGEVLAPMIQESTGFETRSTALGYLLRGGTPDANDRILATRLGTVAMRRLLDGESGVTIGQIGSEVVATPIQQAVAKLKLVKDEDYQLAATFF